MPARNNIQFDNNFERDRYSNFVVDLRRPEMKKAAQEEDIKERAKREIKEIKKEFKSAIIKKKEKIEKELQDIKPNLLIDKRWGKPKIFGKQLENLSGRLWQSSKQFFNRLKKRTSKANSKSWFKLFASRPKAAKNLWQETIAKERQIFSSSPRLSSKRAKLVQAEATVSLYRSLFGFFIVLLLIVLPIKLLSHFKVGGFHELEDKIMSRTKIAMNNLLAAGDSVTKMDFKNADSKFQAASENFLAAESELSRINDSLLSLASLANDPKLKLAAESKKFLAAGAATASLGRNLVLATDSLFNGDKNNFGSTLDNFLAYGQQAVSDARELQKQVDRINPDNLPAEYRTPFTSLGKQVGFLADNLDNFVNSGQKLKEVIGLTSDKRYLVVFQNNAELRASGGFIGSYALVDLSSGKIKNLETPGGGSYDTEAGMNVRAIAPQALWLVNPLWHFWDANWWPDWPTTARNLMWFYSKSGGPSVDGVISVTPTVMERLLQITGPIDMTTDYGVIITADNFWETTQKITEQKNLAKTNPEAVASLPVQTDNKPKKIIGDLLAKVLEVLPQKLTKDNLLPIITMFADDVSEKQILVYFSDPILEREIASYNWSGTMKDNDKDYLMVVNTNIAGQKTDRVIDNKTDLVSEVNSNGEIINTLTITRAHTGIKNEPLTGVRNVDWLRVYVPSGSELISAEGFRAPEEKYLQAKPEAGWQNLDNLENERTAATDPVSGTKIYSENNKTVFANWTMVDPGETAVIVLKYRLPFNFFTTAKNDNWLKQLNGWLNPEAENLSPYSLMVQKQPGASAQDFSSRLILPTGVKIAWHYPDNLNTESGWQISDKLNKDKYWLILTSHSN